MNFKYNDYLKCIEKINQFIKDIDGYYNDLGINYNEDISKYKGIENNITNIIKEFQDLVLVNGMSNKDMLLHTQKIFSPIEGDVSQSYLSHVIRELRNFKNYVNNRHNLILQNTFADKYLIKEIHG